MQSLREPDHEVMDRQHLHLDTELMMVALHIQEEKGKEQKGRLQLLGQLPCSHSRWSICTSTSQLLGCWLTPSVFTATANKMAHTCYNYDWQACAK